jgi:hypothetical protein
LQRVGVRGGRHRVGQCGTDSGSVITFQFHKASNHRGCAAAGYAGVGAGSAGGPGERGGLIPVMMYHRVTLAPAGEYDTSCEDFRAGLQRMFAAGYRPVRTIDLVRGQLPVAAGYSPVVLTFDDGYADQFQLTANGQLASDCAVGILQRVCREFPHCPPAGTFNINRNPFGLYDPADRVTGLTRLHRLGFEIANHTYGHDNLAWLTAAGVQQDFVELQRMVRHAVPGVAVRTMALPYGDAGRHGVGETRPLGRRVLRE